jgi:hypothetical protein
MTTEIEQELCNEMIDREIAGFDVKLPGNSPTCFLYPIDDHKLSWVYQVGDDPEDVGPFDSPLDALLHMVKNLPIWVKVADLPADQPAVGAKPGDENLTDLI